jgi:hypothetical protein
LLLAASCPAMSPLVLAPTSTLDGLLDTLVTDAD